MANKRKKGGRMKTGKEGGEKERREEGREKQTLRHSSYRFSFTQKLEEKQRQRIEQRSLCSNEVSALVYDDQSFRWFEPFLEAPEKSKGLNATSTRSGSLLSGCPSWNKGSFNYGKTVREITVINIFACPSSSMYYTCVLVIPYFLLWIIV